MSSSSAVTLESFPEATEAIATLEQRLRPLQQQLAAHPIYRSIETLDHLRLFMQSHVFAVWDFMTLLKSLQRTLTCVDLPWVPTASPPSRRFINEIVLGEESDEYQGRAISHFELYLEAMDQVWADTSVIRRVIADARTGLGGWNSEGVPPAARQFVETTFRVVRGGSPAARAAAFAFGREDAIPDMFRLLVRGLNTTIGGDLDLFVWYLERHIEVDGEDHGPLSRAMVQDLCGDDPAQWEAAAQAAEDAIRARIQLWDGLLDTLRSHA